MAACPDFPAVHNFLQTSLIIQSNLSADESSVGPKMQRGQNGERGLLVVAENPVATAVDGGSYRSSFETMDDMHIRCQEDDDSAAEDVQECRSNSFPEAKQAPYYVRLRIGLDTRDALPPVSPSGISSSNDDLDNNNNNGRKNTMAPRPTNQHKMTYFVGVDNVVPFSLLGRDDDGNNLFAFQKEDSLTVNHTLRDHVATLQRECSAVVVDDRDHTGTFWNVVGEMLMSSVRECAAKKGLVKIFAMATPAVTMMGANTLSKLYDLSKLPEDDSPERENGGGSAAEDMPPPRRAAQPEPTIQYAPGRDEYSLSGVGAVDLLVPPELDPDEPPTDEAPEATVTRKKEHIATLLYHWIKMHRHAMTEEGSAHVVMIIQRIPDCDAPDDANLSVIVGLFDETRSKLVKADAQKHKPGTGTYFSVWSKELKEGEHHSQRLTSATGSVASLVHELVKITSRGPGARKEMQSSDVRQLIRSHVVTRLLKGSLCAPKSRLAWICCTRKGQEMHAGHHAEPYSNESSRLKSYAVPPTSYFMYVRLMDALSTINKYRIRKVPPMVRPTAPTSVRSTPRGGRTEAFGAPRIAVVQRGYFHANAKAPAAALKRFIILRRKLQDMEVQNRSKMLREERVLRGKIDRAYVQFRLKEFAQHRRKAIESKRVEIKKNIVQAHQDRRRRLVIRQRRQYTPPGMQGPHRWDPSPAEPLINRKRAKTPPPVPKRAIRAAARVYAKPKASAAAEPTPWAAPQLPSAKGPQKRVPVKPTSGPSPAGPRGRPPPSSSAMQTEIKKQEMDEFMKRTMVEQEWSRGVRTIINDVFDDEESVAERLLVIQKGGVPPAHAASPLRSVTSSESFPRQTSSVSGKNLTERKRVGSGGHATSRHESASSIRETKGPASLSTAAVSSPTQRREASISPASTRSSNTSTEDRKPVDRNELPRSTEKTEPPKRDDIPPSPAVSRSSSASSRVSTRSSYKSSRGSSRSESVASNHSASETPSKNKDSQLETQPEGGPMVPIPVESAGVYVAANQETEEFYHPPKASSDVQLLSARSGTVRSLNGSTSVTKVVRTTSKIEPLHSDTISPGCISGGASGGHDDVHIEDVSEAHSSTSGPAAAVEEAIATEEMYHAAEGVVAGSNPNDVQGVVFAAPTTTTALAAQKQPSHSDDEDYASDSCHEEEVVPTSPSRPPKTHNEAIAVEPQGEAEEGPKILRTQPSRKRFQSADFNDLTTFDYGPEAAAEAAAQPPPSVQEKPFGNAANLVVDGRRASDASTFVDATGNTRRRSSIGHLLGNHSDEELDVLDL